MNFIHRKQYDILISRLSEAPSFIQVVEGPRQVGKTTLLLQVQEKFPGRQTLVSGDDIGPEQPRLWLSTYWQQARTQCEREPQSTPILCIDEIQKIPDWSTVVKALWDENRKLGVNFHVVVSGSSALHLRQGLSESLAGRFEKILMMH